ncbi:hypothetical protein M2451_003228 [Dysgonomonas sp. PFB1-18]|uniref:hypothetical protein n=1 Tax=unclassified Dysgonomonas TaxID=2630389 RepID=UPI0024731F2D|nr:MULTISPECIES: hypothetical protein [unclassified Dysgonomonas]MDL2302780.1 hypothetical protein [Dysgonomonas sp. OttesenSCG-928-D17]MDH6310341.1 hypothetical protein [Dysgonomonas sp. PF1-14]MDH6340329.1 hypothetical protein [Dysgonomonas sp. PF1-16]MDH6381891.1 hypothetical protein [Dysgonomonas sp. PFB1-18]MDH6399300.1 hypothetical protein [Dysgonomonas sp. PF1-23]
MKKILFLLLLIPAFINAQDHFAKEYNTADSLLQNYEIEKAYFKFKELEKQLSKSDSLYAKVIWYQVQITTILEQESRMAQDFEKSLQYGMESLELIQNGKEFFDIDFAHREPFMIKNIIVSNIGLGKYSVAKEYKDLLYKSYREKMLPQGIDEHFNFDYFKWEDKNIWGYEWYAELPKDRFSSSFTKVVYYVYSTNPDGSDKDQLYRLHVLMFHSSNSSFDYVLTKYVNTTQGEQRGTLYAYTYKEVIDFEKLHNDVIRVLEGKAESDLEIMLNKKEK